MKRPSINLLNLDGSLNRRITVHERNLLLNSKPPQIKRKSTKRAQFETYQLLPQPVAIRDMHEASAPSITKKDMLVNAGLKDGNRKHVRAKVKAHKGFRWRATLKKEIEDQGIVFDA
jgi:hypothetical protein